MQPLTDRQQQLFDFMLDYVLDHHDQPTCEEMSRALGLASKSGVLCHIEALVRKGWLTPRNERKKYGHVRYSFAGVTLTASREAATAPATLPAGDVSFHGDATTSIMP